MNEDIEKQLRFARDVIAMAKDPANNGVPSMFLTADLCRTFLANHGEALCEALEERGREVERLQMELASALNVRNWLLAAASEAREPREEELGHKRSSSEAE